MGLAAGSQVLIKDSLADQRVFVQGPAGNVTNRGTVAAAQAELKAKGGNVYALAGNNGGQITATGTATINGEAWLISNGGTTQVSGTVIASNANGAGGSIETSGHDLNFSRATVKTGQGGNWLLDPFDVLIDTAAATTIQNSLATTNVTVETTATTASGAGTQTAGSGDITVGNSIAWASGNSLTLSAYRNIGVNNGVTISNTGAGNLTLRADNSSIGTGTVAFTGTGGIDFSASTGDVALLYNPSSYATPTDFSPNVLTNGSWTAPADGSVSSQMTAYRLVNSAANLQNLDANDAGTYALGRDIDLSSISNFISLGQSAPNFSGILDGKGHTVNGLTQQNPISSVYGLFGSIRTNGKVRNLTMTNATISDAGSNRPAMGLLVADNSGTISNVSVSGTLSTGTGAQDVGGLAGYNYGIIQNSGANATIDATLDTNDYLWAGGLVGENGGTIRNSSAAGSVSGVNALEPQLGGLVGDNSGSISGSYATGAVYGGSGANIGGLVGYHTNYGSSTASITNSYATGPVLAPNVSLANVGGLIGFSNAATTNSYATGPVSGGTTSNVGGLIGANYSPVTGSYATSAVSAGSSSEVGGLIGYNNAPVN